MPIEVGIWKIGERLEPVALSRMASELQLESLLADDISVVDPGLLLIGRQVQTAYGKLIDLLAIDSEGQLVVLELKRDRTPREIVAQLLDYGSWVRDLEANQIEDIFDQFSRKHYPDATASPLSKVFCNRFEVDEFPEVLNTSHKLVLVASELDESSERIIRYLADEYGVSINAVFFRVFQDGPDQYLSRAWLSDPQQVDEKVEARREKLPWNGEFYATFGGRRDWQDARKYGFFSAGGGEWYSRTLALLEPGGRVWVNIPRVGYVGVGIVESLPEPMDEFRVDDGSGVLVPIESLPLGGDYNQAESQSDPTKAEHFVRVRWLKTLPVEEAIREKGLFGNQNSVAKPRTKKWRHTIERLKERFGVEGCPRPSGPRNAEAAVLLAFTV